MKAEENIETKQYLAQMVKSQLDQTRLSFDESKKTSSVFLGISTFLFTVNLGAFAQLGTNNKNVYFLLIPLILVLISFFLLIVNFYSVNLPNGYSKNWYEKKLISTLDEIIEIEIFDILEDIKVIKTITKDKNKNIFISSVLYILSLLSALLVIILNH